MTLHSKGVAIGGGSLYDAKAAEPVPAVAASTTAQPATTEETVPKSETATEETVPKSETASDAVPPLVEVNFNHDFILEPHQKYLQARLQFNFQIFRIQSPTEVKGGGLIKILLSSPALNTLKSLWEAACMTASMKRRCLIFRLSEFCEVAV